MIFTISFSHAQGSGNVISYNGSTQYIDLGSQVSDGCRTIEMWFKPNTLINSSIPDAISLLARDYLNGSGLNTNEFGFYFSPGWWNAATGGKLVWYRRVAQTSYVCYSNAVSWQPNVWYHVSGVIDPVSGMKMYINGVLQTSTDPSTQPIQVQTGAATDMIALATWGYWGATTGNRFFNGDIDEVRFWTTARTQTEVRDNMCRKINPVQPGLRAYYRFDSNLTTTLSDLTGNNWNGTLVNLPNNCWHYSSAPIGDTATNVYPGSWVAQTLSLQYMPGDQFSISNVTSSPAGAHIYRVNSLPNMTAGLTAPQTNYYGVFLTGTSGNFTITQDFSAYSNFCSASCLSYHTRNDNAVTSWTALAPAYALCSLSKTNESSVGVSYRAEYILDIANAIPPNILGPDTTVCTNQPYPLNATYPGATYLWNTNATTPSITALTAGTYWVDLTVNGCTVRDSILISNTPPPVISLGNDTMLCQGLNITLSSGFAGATSYTWSSGQTTSAINVGTTGTYSLDVNNNGCHSFDTINVTFIPLPQFSLGNDTTICNLSSLSLNTIGGANSYLWSTGQTTSSITVSSAGLYWAEVTSNGCTTRDSILINTGTSPVITLGNDTSLCQGQNITLSSGFAGATSYTWSSGQTTSTINVGSTGTYSIDVNNNGCHSFDTINVTFTPLPQFSLGNDTTICNLSSLSLNTIGGANSYLWSTGQTTSSITVSSAGLYWADVTSNGCTTRDSILINTGTTPAISLGNDTSLCQGQNITLSSGFVGATGYTWSSGQTTSTINVGTTGTYSIDVDNNGCHSFDTINVTFIPLPQFSLGNDTSVCNLSSLTLNTVNGANSYLWNTGQTTSSITVSSAGLYWADVTSNGCTATDSILINSTSVSQPNLGNDTTLCPGDQITFSVNDPNASFLWSDGSTDFSLLVTNPETVWVSETYGNCRTTDTVNVNYLNAINLGPDRILCDLTNGIPLDAGNQGPGSHYHWNTGDTTQTIVVNEPGIYWVNVSVNSNCSLSDTISLLGDLGGGMVYLPNSFTPNGNGRNDIFYPVSSSITQLHMQIFNRWGQLIFETNDINGGWDGKYKGNLVEEGVYVVVIDYETSCSLGQDMEKITHVNVIR